MMSKKAVLGICEDHEQAGNVVANLRLKGFPTKVISIVFLDERGRGAAADDSEADSEGLRVGGAVGFFSEIFSLRVAGLAPVLAGGPLAATLRGAPGGLGHCLGELGIPVLEGRLCERDVRDGKILIVVHAEPARLRACVTEVFKEHGAAAVEARREPAPGLERAA